jgi:hypothetical protein
MVKLVVGCKLLTRGLCIDIAAHCIALYEVTLNVSSRESKSRTVMGSKLGSAVDDAVV